MGAVVSEIVTGIFLARVPERKKVSASTMNAPQYQLAVQIPSTLIGSRIDLGELEDKVRSHIYGIGKMDDSIAGDDETDLFISTNDPQRVFRAIKPCLEMVGILDQVQAAFRRTDQQDYTVIWPAETQDDMLM